MNRYNTIEAFTNELNTIFQMREAYISPLNNSKANKTFEMLKQAAKQGPSKFEAQSKKAYKSEDYPNNTQGWGKFIDTLIIEIKTLYTETSKDVKDKLVVDSQNLASDSRHFGMFSESTPNMHTTIKANQHHKVVNIRNSM